MANDIRGEVEIEFGGKKRVLRPTFEAICEIETRAGEGIPALISRMKPGTLGFKHIAAIIYGGLIGSDVTDYTFDQVGQIVKDDGFSRFIIPAAKFLVGAMTPKPEKPEGKTGKKKGDQEESP